MKSGPDGAWQTDYHGYYAKGTPHGASYLYWVASAEDSGRFERYLEEIEFLAEIAPHQVALGSDFAGINRPAPDGKRLFDEFRGIWGIKDFAERLAAAHGEDFARSYCGGALKAHLAHCLPE